MDSAYSAAVHCSVFFNVYILFICGIIEGLSLRREDQCACPISGSFPSYLIQSSVVYSDPNQPNWFRDFETGFLCLLQLQRLRYSDLGDHISRVINPNLVYLDVCIILKVEFIRVRESI